MLGIQTKLSPTDFPECSYFAFHIARALAREYRPPFAGLARGHTEPVS
jgi:hypothetical protein